MSDTRILGKNAKYVTLEGKVASGKTIYPGMIIEETGTYTGGAGAPTPLVQPVSTQDKVGENFRVALPPDTPPHNDDADLPRQHEYTEDEHIEYAVVYAGRVQNALLANGSDTDATSDANIDYDERLGTFSDGSLQLTSTAGATLARAREDVDNSGGSGTEGVGDMARIDVEVV